MAKSMKVRLISLASSLICTSLLRTVAQVVSSTEWQSFVLNQPDYEEIEAELATKVCLSSVCLSKSS